MTTPTAPDAGTDRGTVGDILLARGYITEEQLTHAVGSQQQSGKPLGQVLVEAGAITRLELASALAEQWSDTATWLGPPAGAPSGRESKRKRASADDGSSIEAREAGYTQQLQEAVVSLARRVALFEPELADLKLRVELGETESNQRVLDRLEVVQDGLTVLSRRLDELAEATEKTLRTMQEGAGGLAGEIEALSAKVELTAQTEAVAELRGRVDLVEELRGRIDELEERPSGDPELRGAVEVLTSRLDVLADRLGEVSETTAGRADAASLDALRTTVEELAAGATEHVEAAALAQIRDRVEELAASVADRAEDTALAELRTVVEDLAARPQADPGLADRLEELTGRIEALAGTDALDAVRAAVEEIAGRPGLDPELTARIDELAASVADRAEDTALAELRTVVEDLAARPQADPGLADRLEELTGRIEALAGTDALDAVRAAVEEIAGRPGSDPELGARIDELTARVGELGAGLDSRPEHAALAQVQDALDELSAKVAALAEAEALEELRASLAEVSERPAVAPELVEQLSELAARIETLAAETSSGDAADVEAVRAELAEIASRTPADPDVERRVDHVVSRLDALHARIEEVATGLDSAETGPAADPELTGSVASVSARVDELAAAVEALGDPAGSAELADMRGALEGVAERLGAVDAIGERLHAVEQAAAALPTPEPFDQTALQAELESRIAEAAERIAGQTASALEGWASERGALEAKLDALTTALAEVRAQAAAPAPPPVPRATSKAKAAPVPNEEPTGNVESELERLRMAVERINLHLGERERAIAELIRSRGEVKVEDLVARIAELEQANGTAPASKAGKKGAAEPALGASADIHADLRGLGQRLEEAEKIAKADRDKLLAQLERMASSIDWRFRRLETGEETAA